MPARSSWEGFLRFNLISVPVKAYNATASGGGKIGFHLLHAKCHQRIRYKKVCPTHGEVENDEIVSGYEHAKGEFVTVDKAERSGLNLADDKAIDIDTFIPPDAIDPIYFSGRTYYLVPHGQVAQKPFAVLVEAMKKHNRYAVGRVIFSGRGHVAVVRPLGRLMAMTLLSYENQVKAPATFEDEVATPAVSSDERKLAETLLDAATASAFDLAEYKDDYAGKLAKMVAAKAKANGKKRGGKGAPEEPRIINLMDALRQSIAQAKHGNRSTKRSPAKKTKATRGVKKSVAAPHRKTG